MEQVVGSAPVEKAKKGVLSVGSISGGAFFGGPFVGGWMLGENFKELGRPDLAKKYKIGGFIVFILLMVIASYVKSTETSLGIISPALAYALFDRYQKKETETYIANGGIKRKKWPIVCILFIVVFYILLIVSLVGNIWVDGKIKTQEDQIKNDQEGVSLMQTNKPKYKK